MVKSKRDINRGAILARWKAPGGWKLFARECLRVNLDAEQEAILDACQQHKMVSVVSGTGRGKDYTAAVIALCFLFLTPVWDSNGVLVENTKVVLTAPTDRQVGNVMVPEITRIYNNAAFRLPGRLVGYDIRTDYKEWFLTGFAADPTKPEAWAGLHAVHVMFIATEASGIADLVFNTIEGNLQGDSRLVLIANPNISVGYLAESQRSERFKKFRLNSLNAPNVLHRKILIPGQVDYDWVLDKVINWTRPISSEEFRVEEGDFEFENQLRRPNDEFRKKVLGMFPKVSQGVLVPPEWITLANERWKLQQQHGWKIDRPLRLGVDVAGMGRDTSCLCHRFGDYVEKFANSQGAGTANHMEVTGQVFSILQKNTNEFAGKYAQAFIDTIGEGAGVYSRLVELPTEKPANAWLKDKAHSCKFSESAVEIGGQPMKDITGVYEFLNMRAWAYWALRDWLDPSKGSKAMLPEDDQLLQELSETQWKFRSDGKIQIEPKEDIKKRIKRSPDKADALANTFWPIPDIVVSNKKKQNIGQFFH